jgi:sugar lactone lactonase YvrE
MNRSFHTTLTVINLTLRVAALLALLLTASFVQTVHAADPQFGDAEVLAQVPAPGFPEGIARRGHLTFVTGPATFGTAGNGIPSKIWVYHTFTGALLHTEDVVGEDLSQEHANSCVALDGWGRVYVLNTQLGLLRYIALPNGQLINQQVYGQPLPNLPPLEVPPLSNDLAFDLLGNCFVTDSLQGIVWRYPAGFGLQKQPQIWFQDAKLAPGGPGAIGVNGIRLNPQHNKIFISVSQDATGGGHIYTLPWVANPQPADLKLFHSFKPGDLPDGIAFGQSGVLYVTDATPFSSGIIGLRGNGVEVFRFTNPVNTPINPYDSPANVAFDGQGSLLVTNHAFVTGQQMPQQFQVLKVFVRDYEAGLFKPFIIP